MSLRFITGLCLFLPGFACWFIFGAHNSGLAGRVARGGGAIMALGLGLSLGPLVMGMAAIGDVGSVPTWLQYALNYGMLALGMAAAGLTLWELRKTTT